MTPKQPQGVLISSEHGPALTEASLSRVWQHWKQDGFGIVSANRGERTKDENDDWYIRLRKRVRHDGYGFIPLIGYWIERSTVTGEEQRFREPSLLVPANGATPEVLRADLISWGRLDLNKKMWQESVIFVPPEGPVEFISPTTEKVNFKLPSFSPGKVAKTYSILRKSLGKDQQRTFVFEGWNFSLPPMTQGEAYNRTHDGETFFVSR